MLVGVPGSTSLPVSSSIPVEDDYAIEGLVTESAVHELLIAGKEAQFQQHTRRSR